MTQRSPAPAGTGLAARSFESLGDSLLEAQEEYLSAKELDESLFGEDYE